MAAVVVPITVALIGAVAMIVSAVIPAGESPPAPAATQAPPQTRSGPAITLTPASGPPETTVEIGGTGFGREELVRLTIDVAGGGNPIRLADPSTDATGGFAGTRVVVPSQYASVAPAELTVRAVGQTSGREARATFDLS